MTQRLLENILSEDLKNLISEYSANKIFLVTGKASYERSGAKEFVEALAKALIALATSKVLKDIFGF